MAIRSRYDTMQRSTTVQDDVTGEYYFDPLTFPIESFSYTSVAINYHLADRDILRIDFAMSDYYGVAQYDDVVLWLNNIPYIYDVDSGELVSLPKKADVERFFTQFTV